MQNKLVSVLLGLALCQHVYSSSSHPSQGSSSAASTVTADSSTATYPPHVQPYTLSSDGISATFIPYGARLTSLLVSDRHGNIQDVVTGYDDPAEYLHDTATNHTYFGAIVGRYANRIKNGTFTLDGHTYHIPKNEHGLDTLHGGSVGYDQRNWTVTAHNKSSVTFMLQDNAFEGFPGTVITYATFSVSNSAVNAPFGQPRPRLTAKTVSLALDSPTPIMLANHIYWNLDGFGAATVLNDTLWMPYSDRYIETDTILVPMGDLGTVASKPPLDFTTPHTLGSRIQQAKNVCGEGCTGYDTAFIIDRPIDAGLQSSSFPALSLWSNLTGIKMDVSTNQQGFQIYSCDGQNGTIPVKPSQVARNKRHGVKGAAQFVNKYGCIVIETQGWIDAINNPQWGQEDYQIFSPDTGPAVMYATYDFSTF